MAASPTRGRAAKGGDLLTDPFPALPSLRTGRSPAAPGTYGSAEGERSPSTAAAQDPVTEPFRAVGEADARAASAAPVPADAPADRPDGSVLASAPDGPFPSAGAAAPAAAWDAFATSPRPAAEADAPAPAAEAPAPPPSPAVGRWDAFATRRRASGAGARPAAEREDASSRRSERPAVDEAAWDAFATAPAWQTPAAFGDAPETGAPAGDAPDGGVPSAEPAVRAEAPAAPHADGGRWSAWTSRGTAPDGGPQAAVDSPRATPTADDHWNAWTRPQSRPAPGGSGGRPGIPEPEGAGAAAAAGPALSASTDTNERNSGMADSAHTGGAVPQDDPDLSGGVPAPGQADSPAADGGPGATVAASTDPFPASADPAPDGSPASAATAWWNGAPQDAPSPTRDGVPGWEGRDPAHDGVAPGVSAAAFRDDASDSFAAFVAERLAADPAPAGLHGAGTVEDSGDGTSPAATGGAPVAADADPAAAPWGASAGGGATMTMDAVPSALPPSPPAAAAPGADAPGSSANPFSGPRPDTPGSFAGVPGDATATMAAVGPEPVAPPTAASGGDGRDGPVIPGGAEIVPGPGAEPSAPRGRRRQRMVLAAAGAIVVCALGLGATAVVPSMLDRGPAEAEDLNSSVVEDPSPSAEEPAIPASPSPRETTEPQDSAQIPADTVAPPPPPSSPPPDQPEEAPPAEETAPAPEQQDELTEEEIREAWEEWIRENYGG
ncbi:hypothetical protein [Nocardiopsis trehalosi]|uniref:hypothetical protein n=1 Tax=Nocardiopsis trehalosi TaxID=109329 RepID=UPI00082F68F5|nr:hypothetical protein [Nocardiopsis trehalosi]